MKRGPENAVLKMAIAHAERAARKSKTPAYKRVAEILSRSRRRRVEVNLYKLAKLSKDGESIVIPGKLLGIGKLDKARKFTVAAFNVSEVAVKKLAASGVKLISIDAMIAANPSGKGIKIII